MNLTVERSPVDPNKETTTSARLARTVGDVRRLVRAFSTGGAVVLAIWSTLFVLHSAFPYLRPGADIIYSAKIAGTRTATLFPPTAKTKLLIFGNSKVLAGFIPRVFDAALERRGFHVSSYNFGLPNAEHFVGELEDLVRRGQIPNIILVTIPWKATQHSISVFKPIESDRAIVDAAFPFRHLPRDLCVFLALSLSRGGVRALYEQGHESIVQMRADRGYYFIAGESHHLNNRLPDEFTLESDTPSRPAPRLLDFRTAEFDRLAVILKHFQIRCILVPTYFRPRQFASVPNPTSEILWHGPTIEQIGPDYYNYSNALFSDIAHLNPIGAEQYTTDLAALVSRRLQGDLR